METKEATNSENNQEEYPTVSPAYSSAQNGQNCGFSKGIT